jgi:hypothetical protein
MAKLLLTAAQFCQLTGVSLTERRLRQLAEHKYFPPPVDGQFEADKLLIGFIKYQEEKLRKKDDTLANERAKYMKARREKAEIETSILKGDFISSDEVERVYRNVLLHFKAVLQLRLEIEEPPKLAGLSVVQLGERMEGVVNELLRILREGLSRWVKEPPKK